ncbi:transporter substrate-binding domain-containing protein, partial [Mesorhizobium sp. M2A.F.Ca.ET.037.01.1.1]|uniref:transporter substrate-binding domain-containing protein n=1 Tax=Mesorhizobium sp. M2A.F.Ca.ET.037.01.1.1 TaxID=2496748 RepID=UPI001FDFCAC9
ARAEDRSLVLDRIKASGKLKFPVMVAEEPGYIKDEWSGFFVDWGKDIAGLMGVQIEYYETTWGNLAADFQAGKIDLAVALNPNPRRGLVVDYVPGAIVEGIWALVARPGFEPKSWREMDTKEARVAVQKGGTMQVIAESVIPNATIVVVPSRNQAILELQSGKVDAIIIADEDAAFLDSNSIGKAVVPMPVLRNPSTIAIRREPSNAGFANFLANWMVAAEFAGSRLLVQLERGIDMKVVPQSGKYC